MVEELVNMIQTQRAYEMNSKAIQTSDQMLAKLSQLPEPLLRHGATIETPALPSAPAPGRLLCAAWLAGCASLSPTRRWTCCPPRHQR